MRCDELLVVRDRVAAALELHLDLRHRVEEPGLGVDRVCRLELAEGIGVRAPGVKRGGLVDVDLGIGRGIGHRGGGRGDGKTDEHVAWVDDHFLGANSALGSQALPFEGLFAACDGFLTRRTTVGLRRVATARCLAAMVGCRAGFDA